MKFIDEVNIKVQAGKGGNGMIAFRREAHVDKGGPDGGDGGNGGSIYFVGEPGMNTLLTLYLRKIIKGNDGENGRRKNQYGAAGEDIYVKVPLGTLVYDGNKLLHDITEERPYLIAKGGKGGRGNTKFKSSRNTAPSISENGDFGEKYSLKLNLKVLADVGFLGKPSAGKSTILSKISNAKPKIADYHFTTLVPQLGLVRVNDNSFVAADLPGLIQGAAEGKGLGIQFLKHIERCRVIAHIVDFGDEDKNPIEDFIQINNELKSYNLKLEERKQLVVANKSDMPLFEEHFEKFKEKFPEVDIIKLSALEDKNIEKLKLELWKLLEKEKTPMFEKTFSEVTITLEKYFEVIKVHEGLYDITGPEVEEIYHKIPIISHDNLMRFNRKLREIGVWEQLISQGVQPGDTVRIFDYEFTWESED